MGEFPAQTGFFETPDTPNGAVRYPGPPTWFSRTPARVTSPAPLGAHNREILGGLGDQPPARE